MPIITPLPLYGAFTAFTPTIPKFYWDVYSQEERIKCICGEITKIIAYMEANARQTNANTREIEELKELFRKFQESGFKDYYKEQVERWISEHLDFIYENTMKQVYFGLTEDGYFCAYVPDGWRDVRFDTGMVYGRSDYGRLILRYDVEGQGVIDNTYEYTLNNPDKAKIMADLETVANKVLVPLTTPNPDKFTINEGSYSQNGYVVTLDCKVTVNETATLNEVIVDNLPVGSTEYSALPCIDGGAEEHTLYIDQNTLCVGDDTIEAGTVLYINSVYFAVNSNI